MHSPHPPPCEVLGLSYYIFVLDLVYLVCFGFGGCYISFGLKICLISDLIELVCSLYAPNMVLNI